MRHDKSGAHQNAINRESRKNPYGNKLPGNVSYFTPQK